MFAVSIFSFSIFNEPHSLDPQKTNMTSGGYFFFNIYRGLMKVDGKDQLKPEMAESCKRVRTSKIVCRLRPDVLWSDGNKIVAADFVKAFQALIDPNNKYPEAELLIAVKNARAIHRGEKTVDTLGVKALDQRRLQIELSEPDQDFEWKLAHPALSPRPLQIAEREKVMEQVVNGPYKISDWKIGSKIFLTPNPNYYLKNPNRPNLEVLFIQDDSLALRMFEGKRLSFNRRVIQESVKPYLNHSGFKRIPLARFDYIGFGPGLKDQALLRKALLKGADYSTFAQLFESKSTAGCPAIDKRFFGNYFCIETNLSEARKLLEKVPQEALEKKYVFGFSQLGGVHVENAAQWFQGQWKKNLGLNIELKSQEQGVYLRQLKNTPPDLFRKGVTLDRLSCLAGLELFESSHPENYVKFSSKEYDQVIKLLNQKQTVKNQRELCSKGFKILIDEAVVLPLGEMYFNVISDPDYKGWSVNSLNILDLTDLHKVKP